jgi:hypothetical protein
VQRPPGLIKLVVLDLAEWYVELVHVLGKILKRNAGLAVLDQIKRVSDPEIKRVANCCFASRWCPTAKAAS